MSGPQLRKQGDAVQLWVNDRPLLVLGGELHNSSSSSLEYMQPIWPRMVELGLNTLLTPVTWELIEPEEGRFDFSLVDGLIREARRYGLRLVFLWFGSWKNGMSSYAPLWVKRDGRRFERVKLSDGRRPEVLSCFCRANVEADARAFAALMRHVGEVDRAEQTVVMVQVENEIGVLGDTRDRSAGAEAAFRGPVPKELMEHLVRHRDELVPELRELWGAAGWKTAGTWEEVFGRGPRTDEIFQAWHYARYVDQVAAAGKREYAVPMFVNAWLGGPEAMPGTYPSGGPLPHVMDIWQAGAPHIDFLSPDIYSPDFARWCRRYRQRGNPLFIPETRRSDDGARNAFYAIGEEEAMGISPFAVDSIENPAESGWAKTYAALREVEGVILKHQGRGEMCGFVLDVQHSSTRRRLGEYELVISLDEIFGRRSELGFGLIVRTGPEEFLGVGSGFRVSFRLIGGGVQTMVGLGPVEEGRFEGGRWIAGRRLNGDETDQGQGWRFGANRISIQKCVVYRCEVE